MLSDFVEQFSKERFMCRLFFKIALCINLFIFTRVASADIHDSYKYLIENTIWIVPPSTLLAYQFDAGTYTQAEDQTVWIINSYDGGYFFGDAYVGINGTSTLSHSKMLGSITNSGDIYITFYPTSGSPFSQLVNGIGTFRKEQGSYRFIMQMNSGSSTEGISHWSYMININENSPYYNNLPGVGLSVPDFIALF
jgi:hypothetical protein